MTLNERWWSSSSGRIELRIRWEDVEACSHQGRCDDDVESAVGKKYLAKQLARIKQTTLRDELKEYGAWDEHELKDHEANIRRLVWVACCDIMEGHHASNR